MAESMVDRVERAMTRFFEGSESGAEGTWWRIHDGEEDNRVVGRWTDRGERDAQMSYMNARAAIAAMREPNEAMIEAGCAALRSVPPAKFMEFELGDRGGIAKARFKMAIRWRAMIAAALAEPSALGE